MQDNSFIPLLQSVADQNRAIASLVSSFSQIPQSNLKIKVSVYTQTDQAGNADAIKKQYDAMLITDHARRERKPLRRPSHLVSRLAVRPSMTRN